MVYRRCSVCGAVTDEDEVRCPFCGKNPFNGEIITIEKLVLLIKKGEISSSNIRTKSPYKIYQAIQSLPP